MAGVSPDVPGLFGLPVDCLNARLGAWRTGMRQARASDCRAQIARRRSNRPRIGCRWCGAGAFPSSTAGYPRPFGMPPFATTLSDEDIAAVMSCVRNAWGNRSSAVQAIDIQRDRSSVRP